MVYRVHPSELRNWSLQKKSMSIHTNVVYVCPLSCAHVHNKTGGVEGGGSYCSRGRGFSSVTDRSLVIRVWSITLLTDVQQKERILP